MVDKKVVDYTKAIYKKGEKIKLIFMKDEPQMPHGLTGTIHHVDDIGQIHVTWEDGTGLALILGVDGFVKL